MVNSEWVKGEVDTLLHELAKVELMRQSYRKFAYAG